MFGHDGLNGGLSPVIVKEVVLRMDVLFLELVLMIVSGLLIATVVAMFTIEHNKKH
jgi:hypothetical protein